MYLNRLRKMLTENNENYLFPCIRDLVANGLTLERFTNEDNIPSRQDITQYIAAWFKYIGLSSDECREWMTEYCIGMLSVISSSSKSRIRHSTKGNIKYIYKSDVSFDCKCEKNRFKAPCEPTCPIYEEMAHRAKESEAADIVELYETKVEDRVADEIAPIKPSIRDKYNEQFEKALEVAQHHLKKWVPKKKIADLLNESGFKTRTGKKWSYSILANELKKLERNIDKERGRNNFHK
ncbi:MAG: hypothetical protein HF982_08520 [Desulfobacteraceae bacterium]|nr:hypothetical protein [Desulfobacteraceae bacterium]MBC2719612.1 hypothetical protein [Desulfobacteraceae bacterium]